MSNISITEGAFLRLQKRENTNQWCATPGNAEAR